MTTPDTDVRPPDTQVEAIAGLQKQLDDLMTTVMPRLSRKPTGDIEETFRTTAKPDTLLLNGATVSRATYSALWAWIQDQGLAGPSLPFGIGDGTSTFVLPDCRGKGLVGATAIRPVGTTFGAATKTLTTDNLPPHTHTGATGADSPSHTHGGTTNGDSPSHTHYSGGNHYGHVGNDVPGGVGSGARWFDTLDRRYSGDVGTSTNASGPHYHSFGTGNASNAHTHPFTTSSVGASDPVNVESPSISVNVLIWT